MMNMSTWIIDIIIIGKVIFAALLASLVGIQREQHNKPAGLRTHMLVAVGACLVTSVVKDYFLLDPESLSRAMQGIITGIGFLGAGTIIRSKEQVIGLTTAASIWVMACLGIAIALEYMFVAIISTMILLLILKLGDIEEKAYRVIDNAKKKRAKKKRMKEKSKKR